MLKNIYCVLDEFIHKWKLIRMLYINSVCFTLEYHKGNSLRSYNNDPYMYVRREKVLNRFDSEIMRWTLNKEYQ